MLLPTKELTALTSSTKSGWTPPVNLQLTKTLLGHTVQPRWPGPLGFFVWLTGQTLASHRPTCPMAMWPHGQQNWPAGQQTWPLVNKHDLHWSTNMTYTGRHTWPALVNKHDPPFDPKSNTAPPQASCHPADIMTNTGQWQQNKLHHQFSHCHSNQQ